MGWSPGGCRAGGRPIARAVALSAAAWGPIESNAWAGGGVATDAYENIRRDTAADVHALADLYVQHRFQGPSGASVQLRAFDGQSDTLAVGFVRLAAAHRPDPVGFRLDVGVGDTPNALLTSDPAAGRYPDLSRWLSYVEQAFATVVVPVGRGLWVDAGKFSTPVGFEDNESNQNWNYSRSLLFTLAEPTVHTGLRATYPVTDAIAVSGFWLNGWNANIVEGSTMRSFAVAASWKPTEGVDTGVVYAGGLERAPTHLSDPTSAFRHEIGVYGTYELRSWLRFAATADYGADGSASGVSWWGVAGYVRCGLLPWLASVVRGEHFADPDGFMTGTRQTMAEGTVTLEATARVGAVDLIGRLELRSDRSDEPVFRASTDGRGEGGLGGRAVTRQDTSTLGVMAVF
jgi:hypothetical protein